MEEIASFLIAIDEAYDQSAWHGPNLRASVRGVNASQAAWKPAPGRHCIWELTLHAAYWKHVVVKRLTGEKRRFPRKGVNFFPVPTPADEKAWKADLALLADEHRLLRATVAALPQLDDRLRRMLRGIAAHDLYHAGQISLLKRLRLAA